MDRYDRAGSTGAIRKDGEVYDSQSELGTGAFSTDQARSMFRLAFTNFAFTLRNQSMDRIDDPLLTKPALEPNQAR